MYISPKELLGTKILVNKSDARAVQKVLFNSEIGYELNLDKSYNPRKFKTDVCFYISFNGTMTVEEKLNGAQDEEYWAKFYASNLEEINWEALF